MTRVFIGGTEVSKESLKNYEIKDEAIKKIIREAISRKQTRKDRKDMTA